MIREPYAAIERSIIKQFRKEIWRPFVKGQMCIRDRKNGP